MLSLLVALAGSLRFEQVPVYDLVRAYELEKAGYPPDEAASLEKLRLRLTDAGEYFWGAYDLGEKGDGDRVLVGFICGTLSRSKVITARTMATHDPNGNFLAIHSVVVDPTLQRIGVGSWMLDSYLLVPAVEDKVLMLLCKQPLIGFYAAAGFQLQGHSNVVHGQDEWHFMMRKPEPWRPDDRYAQWLEEWQRRANEWFATLAVADQTRFGSCIGALGLHLGSRFGAAMQRLGLKGPSAPPPSPLHAEDGCEFVPEAAGELELPDFPALPTPPKNHEFSIPWPAVPIPSLLPKTMRQLGSAAAAAPQTATNERRASDDRGAFWFPVGGALGFGAGLLSSYGVWRACRLLGTRSGAGRGAEPWWRLSLRHSSPKKASSQASSD